jgi:hypothetical protein
VVDETLVCCTVLAGWGELCSGIVTLQQGLEVVELAGVVELPEVLSLLCKVLPLGERVSLVGDDV